VGVEKLRQFLFENPWGRYRSRDAVADVTALGLYVWDRKTTFSAERTSLCGPCKTTLFASETRQRNPDGSLQRPEVYLDETFVNKNHSGQFYMVSGGRWAVGEQTLWQGASSDYCPCHDGAGWVQGAELVFESTQRTGDYHGQMNWENFSTWFAEQLLPQSPVSFPHHLRQCALP